MAEISLAREFVACPRHEREGRTRWEGSGFRPLKRCTGCGEPAGSISESTGASPMRSREDGEYYLINCLPGFVVVTSVMVETVGV